jgi:hypothetical protein
MKERRNKMTSRRKQGERVPKKPYSKPEVKQVSLKPEEAVLGGCKTVSTQNSANHPAPNTCASPIACSAIAS